MNTDSFERPFPALTVAERVHLDIYGYVVVKNVLIHSDVKTISEKIYEIDVVGMAEEVLGREARLEQSDAHIRRSSWPTNYRKI